MPRRKSRGRRMVICFALLIGASGCGADHAPPPGERTPASSGDVASASALDTTVADRAVTDTPRAAPDPLITRPIVSRAPTTARLVRGTVEVGLGPGKYVPAEYFIVVLEGTRRRYETVTNRSGAYIFESIPAGAYVLVVLADKVRPVHRQRVEVPAGDTTVTLPHVDLVVDSLRGPSLRVAR